MRLVSLQVCDSYICQDGGVEGSPVSCLAVADLPESGHKAYWGLRIYLKAWMKCMGNGECWETGIMRI